MNQTQTESTIHNYEIQTHVLVLREDGNNPEKQIDFHVETGDCFAMFATAMGLLQDSLGESAEKNEPPSSISLMLLRRLKEDFMYLDNTYQIVPKK